MTAGNAILIVAIVTGLGLIGALFFVMFKIRQISREFFGTSNLIEGLKRQEALEDDTQRCENQLKGYLEALEHRDLSYLGNVSLSLKDQVRLKIEEMEEKEIREEFDAIHVHQTEISRYDKNPGKCRIRIQSSVEYLHTLRTPDKKKNVEREKEQHRFNMELVYIQDITKIRDGETAIGVSCPHCGAPIAGLGDRVCPYCGGAVEPVNVRVWELHRIEEV